MDQATTSGAPRETARARLARRELLRRLLLLGGGIAATAPLLAAGGCGVPASPTNAPATPTASAAPASATPPPATPAPATWPPAETPPVASPTEPARPTEPVPTATATPAATPKTATATAAATATDVAATASPTAASDAPPVVSPTATTAPSPAAAAPRAVRAVYLTPRAIGDEATFGALLALADRTEINALVLDVKDESGLVYHASALEPLRQTGAIRPRYDLGQRLARLKERGLYAIARVVCMQDPTLASARPDLAVRNRKTGGAWENFNGVAWVNALRPEVWDYNRAVAVEAAQLGFDEVQYDYVRFPSDGDMAALDLGAPSTPATRSAAIAGFLAGTRAALAPRGVALGADIFGIVLLLKDDNNIGQQLEALAPTVDYLCPMLYPSHFPPGGLGWQLPNDHPYEVVLESLRRGGERLVAARRQFRPWLQDFSFGPGIAYGPPEVRAQIQAAEDFGVTGWMLWNANTRFTEEALAPR